MLPTPRPKPLREHENATLTVPESPHSASGFGGRIGIGKRG